MHRFHFLSLPLALIFLLPAAASAQILILEARPGVELLENCEMVHITQNCGHKHVGVDGVAAVGSTVTLDGEPHTVDWLGRGYHLDSGTILEPMDEAGSDPGRRRWLEIYPNEGKVHVSRGWNDADGDQKLNALDTLLLESGPEKVLDVRLHVWVRPVLKN